MVYQNVLVLFGNVPAAREELARLLCYVEAYNKAAAKHDQTAQYIHSWHDHQAYRTRKNGRKPKPGTIAPIPAIALHKEYEG
jgi:hypothetical protein